ncbi:MAG: DUF1330 domain-containing protein [Phormidesmis sp.]
MSENTPVYLIAQLETIDLEKHFQSYGIPLFPLLQSYGAEVLIATSELAVLEGAYEHNLTAVIKFPSAEAVQRFYQSPEYQPLKAKRLENTRPETSRLVIAPVFTGLP